MTQQEDSIVIATLKDLMAEKKDQEGEFTLTKAELAELLFAQVGLNKREAKEMVDSFFETIRNSLESGELVKLSGFGNFDIRDKAPRPGRNPKTGALVPITARRVVTFHASQKLKRLVEKGSTDYVFSSLSEPNRMG